MKGCKNKKHVEFNSIQKDPYYLKLFKRTNTDVLEKLEDIRKTIENSYDQQVPEYPEDNVIDIQKEMDKYPAIPSLSLLDDLPPVPNHLPSSTYEKKNLLPSLTNNEFPTTLEVEPRELVKWITQKENPRSVLLLDVRPRDMFLQACIKHRWMVQIEPLVLRKDVTSQKIQDSLVLNPEVEQQLFENRHQFDLIVFYDQNSNSVNQLNEPLHYLKTAIYELEFQKLLPRMPMVLVGGFDAWVNTVGSRGTYSFTDPNRKDSKSSSSSQQSPVKQSENNTQMNNQYYIRSNRDEKSEVPFVNHTLYDYFNHKHRGGQLQSMSQSPHYEIHDPLTQYQSYYYNNPLQQQYPIMPVSSHENNNVRMPIPLPSGHSSSLSHVDYNSQNYSNPINHSRYPEIQPNVSTMDTGLSRRKTFIDNPFHGFTTTTNRLYDTPPAIPAKPTRKLPPPPLPQHNIPNNNNHARPQLPPKLPLQNNNRSSSPHTNAPNNTRIAPVSDSSFSQLGSVLIGTTGLKNLGNTCYMNSIIQCLSGTIPFARYFISGMYKQHVNKQNPLGTGGVLADSFAELLRVMWSENYNFISPVTFREALVRFAPQYSGTEQQDSQEFLNFLLDGLHEDLNTIQRKPNNINNNDDHDDEAFEKLPDYQASGIAWEKYMARNASVIVSLFQGQYRSRLICSSCKTTSTTYNTFMSLSLPIPSKSKLSVGNITLYQCLDHFVKEEILEKSDAWHCPKCKKLRKASKSLSLSKLPDVLLIHLKRFSFDGPFRNKLETNIDYPTKNLDLSRYVPKSMTAPNKPSPILNYDLYAVSNHYGTLTGGHYTACVRNGYRGEWHNFDDTRFSVCDEGKVKSRAAYNLFYVRSTVK
ncbi:unnamed protein product [Cunninghamella echinulata]